MEGQGGSIAFCAKRLIYLRTDSDTAWKRGMNPKS